MVWNLTNFIFLFIPFSSAVHYSIPIVSPNASVPFSGTFTFGSFSCKCNSCVVSHLLCWVKPFAWYCSWSWQSKCEFTLLCLCYFMLCRFRQSERNGSFGCPLFFLLCQRFSLTLLLCRKCNREKLKCIMFFLPLWLCCALLFLLHSILFFLHLQKGKPSQSSRNVWCSHAVWAVPALGLPFI